MTLSVADVPLVDLMPFQRGAHDDVIAAVKADDNILVCSPTGTGKSFMELACMASLVARGYTVGLVTSRRSIVRQIRGEEKRFGLNNAIITTPTKFWNELRRGVFELPEVLVQDECHHSLATTWQRFFDRRTKQGKKLKVCGFTATPSRGLETENPEWRKLFKRVSEPITMVEAIRSGVLCPFYVVKRTLGLLGEDTAGSERQQELATERQIQSKLPELFETFCALDPSRPTVIICPNVHAAQTVITYFNFYRQRTPGCLMPELVEVTHKIPDNEREDIYALVARNLKWAVSVNLMFEGLDIPEVSRVAVLRTSVSPLVVGQGYGRGLRRVRREPRPLSSKDAALYRPLLSQASASPDAQIVRAGDQVWVRPGEKRDCEILDFTANLTRFGSKLQDMCGLRFITAKNVLYPDLNYVAERSPLKLVDAQPYASPDLVPAEPAILTLPVGRHIVQARVGRATNMNAWVVRLFIDGRSNSYVLRRGRFAQRTVTMKPSDYWMQVGGRDDLAVSLLARIVGDWRQVTSDRVRLGEVLAYALLRQLNSNNQIFDQEKGWRQNSLEYMPYIQTLLKSIPTGV